jgi:hypothetical protein
VMATRTEIRVIPERTVDSWFSIAAGRAFPRAFIWAPTPNEQSEESMEPWDFVVGTLAESMKLLVFETKALIGYSEAPYRAKVRIDLSQLARLQVLAARYGVPLKYGLPVLTDRQLPPTLPKSDPPLRARLRLDPVFDLWFRVLSPTEVACIDVVRTAILSRRQSVSVATDKIGGFTLRHFFRRVRACEEGTLFGPSEASKPIFPGTISTQQAEEALRSALSRSKDPLKVDRAVRQGMSDPLLDSNTDQVSEKMHLARTKWVWVPKP